ncbi:MAG: cytochrome b/b6 domain-containing protein, partial [Phenylobacterium sp.]
MTDIDRQVRVRLWDLPTRLFHWLLVGLVAFSWFTVETGRLPWHRYSGYAILGLIVFRLIWGVVGSSTARFASFVKGPAAVARYARSLFAKGHAALPGHNPMGGWSVAAMLALLALQVGMGLFVVDDDTGFESGPLSGYVSYERGLELGEWHEIMFNVLLVLIGLHLAAVLFYLLFKRENLISAMLTGRR